MSIIYILIPVAVLFTALGIYFFFWAVKTEQFDDLEKQGMSILFDDEQQKEDLNKVNSNNSNKDKSALTGTDLTGSDSAGSKLT